MVLHREEEYTNKRTIDHDSLIDVNDDLDISDHGFRNKFNENLANQLINSSN